MTQDAGPQVRMPTERKHMTSNTRVYDNIFTEVRINPQQDSRLPVALVTSLAIAISELLTVQPNQHEV